MDNERHFHVRVIHFVRQLTQMTKRRISRRYVYEHVDLNLVEDFAREALDF